MSFFAAICWMVLGAVIGIFIFMALFAHGVIWADNMTWKNFLQRLENIYRKYNRNMSNVLDKN